MARRVEDEMVKLGVELGRIHPTMVDTPSHRPFRDDPRQPLIDLRLRYQHQASTVLEHLAWAIGRLSRMMRLLSSPKLRRLDAPAFERTYSRLDNVEYHRGQAGQLPHVVEGQELIDEEKYWYVALVLDLVPGPVWRVVIVPGSRWGGDPYWKDQTLVLAESSRPIAALVEAGLLKSDEDAYEAWLEDYLAELPEAQMRFNVEPYRLLDSDPFISSLDWFRTWLESVEPRW
jgi:hypothetical protein